jgi:hypothetical protein
MLEYCKALMKRSTWNEKDLSEFSLRRSHIRRIVSQEVTKPVAGSAFQVLVPCNSSGRMASRKDGLSFGMFAMLNDIKSIVHLDKAFTAIATSLSCGTSFSFSKLDHK